MGNLLLHLGRTLDELDPPRWGDPADGATRLVRKVHGLRSVPLGDLRPADLLSLVTQQVALPFVLPLDVRLPADEPLLDAYFHEGDLLLATVSVPAGAWAALPELEARLRAVIAELPGAAVDELPRGGAEALAQFAGKA
ncbi:contact-dependent growth inhibition system immunity protein [Streptomyces sp. H021]|uniref:contact-dependent growth inhibition system immunity protein n=1 Tax=Streptomyces sp. H021 TaxID=1519486 RepID=UPI0006AF0301|nr:contact-dependent growth inhibition system immunity protein [Streptomyces sp. H021]KOV30906.1 hypothetical protein ADK97_27460 [Streptomyces sp. H021]